MRLKSLLTPLYRGDVVMSEEVTWIVLRDQTPHQGETPCLVYTPTNGWDVIQVGWRWGQAYTGMKVWRRDR